MEIDLTKLTWPGAVVYTACPLAFAACVWAVAWTRVRWYRDECEKRVKLTELAVTHPGSSVTEGTTTRVRR